MDLYGELLRVMEEIIFLLNMLNTRVNDREYLNRLYDNIARFIYITDHEDLYKKHASTRGMFFQKHTIMLDALSKCESQLGEYSLHLTRHIPSFNLENTSWN